jgi:hypothetical protein
MVAHTSRSRGGIYKTLYQIRLALGNDLVDKEASLSSSHFGSNVPTGGTHLLVAEITDFVTARWTSYFHQAYLEQEFKKRSQKRHSSQNREQACQEEEESRKEQSKC